MFYFYQLLSAHSPSVTVFPLQRCKNVLISLALYSVESKGMGGRKLCPSLVTHRTAIPEQAPSPIQQLQASFHSSALPDPAKSSSTLLQELGITGAAFSLPFFPFPEKLVSHSVLPLLCWAWLLLAEEVGMCFWSATDGVGRSKVMAGPNWAEFVLLNINFAHLCNSPSVSWKQQWPLFSPGAWWPSSPHLPGSAPHPCLHTLPTAPCSSSSPSSCQGIWAHWDH